MKKVSLILLLVLPLILGQQVVYDSTVTVEWDLVAPIPGSVLTYQLGYAPEGSPGDVVIVGETSAPPFTITVSGTELTMVGVRTVQTVGQQVFYSEWNWSNVDGESTPDPFLLWPGYPGPVAPTGFRRVM